jgi:hypothetical protein
MIMQDRTAGTSPRNSISAEQARGGEIILRRRWQRVLFIIGLAAPLIILLILFVLQW